MTSPSLLLLLTLAWSDGWWGPLSETLNGTLTLGTYRHFEPFEGERHQTRQQARLRLEFSGSLGSNLDYNIVPRLYTDNMGWSSGILNEDPDLSVERHILDFEEAYITLAGDNMDLRFGRQRFTWGKADSYNPMDNLNPVDYLDVPNAEKMGVTSLAFNYFGPNMDLEMVFIPWFTPSRLASQDNRWLGDLSSAAAQFDPLIPQAQDRLLAANTIDQSAVAVRLASSSLISGWDFALSYFDGVDPVGVGQGVVSPPFVNITQVFPQFREIGAAFSTTRGSLEMHGEMGAHYTDGTEMDDDYLEWIVGFNYTVYPTFLEEIFMVVEYADEHILEAKTADNQFSGSGDYVRPFKGTWLGSFTFKLSEETSFKLQGGVNQGAHDNLALGEFSHKFNDIFKLKAGVDLLNGPQNSFFGRWRDTDRLWMNLVIYL